LAIIWIDTTIYCEESVTLDYHRSLLFVMVGEDKTHN